MKKNRVWIIAVTSAVGLMLLSCRNQLECSAYYEVSPHHPKYIKPNER